MTITADRVAISHRDTRSRSSQSLLSMRGIALSALPHMATFGIGLLALIRSIGPRA